MSHVTKRNAEKAFEADNISTPSKKKRVRRHGVIRATTGVEQTGSQATPVKTAINTTVKATPGKLADRITPPSSKINKESVVVPTAEVKLGNKIGAPSTSTNLVQDGKDSTKHLKKKKHSEKPKKSLSKKRSTHRGSWNLTGTSGGFFIDHDPILTADGEYLVLPTKDTVQIYSTKTSLLVRYINVKEKGVIVGCCVAASVSVLLVATKRGSLVKYDLTTGSKIGGWDTGLTLKSITLIEGSSERILVTALIEGQGDQLSIITLQAGKKLDSTIYLQDRQFQSPAAVSSDGSTIVVCEATTVYIARFDSDKYVWHQMRVPGTICSFDVRMVASKKNTSVDIVVGLENGSIFLYENVLQKLRAGTDLSSRKLHWHRTQVRSVKWSRDGNYVISGGDETVLVIWQLETNQQQFLPHLSTAILNIAVSTNGAQYAVRLADNSIMVLDTADLSPSSNIAGLSLPPRNERTPMQLHPQHSNRLLAAVSIRPSGRDSVATHLQTYDIDTSLQLNRQALTRNVTTVVNVSPDGLPVVEPSVTHLQVSSDGTWLATVDKWSPHGYDVQALHLKEDQIGKQEHTETVLRFWKWGEDDSWEASARIDEAHKAGRVSILGLAANPVTSEFATMGEDGCIKIWRPRKRVRDGIQVRNKAGQPLYNWTCTRTTQIEKPDSLVGALAYSEDGSILTASWSRKQRHVYFIDPRTGIVCLSAPGLLSEGPASIAIMGRHLLCLSNNFQVFDMITSQITFAMELERNQSSFLAVNTRADVFAIGLNAREKSTATISVFEINDLEKGAVADIALPAQIRTVISSSGSGFVVVDSDSKVRKLVPLGATITLPAMAEREVGKSLDDVFGRETGETQKLIEASEGPQDLSELFAVSTSGQPGVGDLFKRVSKVFANAQLMVGA